MTPAGNHYRKSTIELPGTSDEDYSAAVQDDPTPAARPGSPRWRPYAVALALTVAILLARIAINPWVGTRPLLLMFLIPIIVSAYLGGMGPGLFATFLAGVVVDYFVLVPKNAFGFEQPLDLAQWFFMIIIGVLISVLFAELDRWRRGQDLASENRHVTTERKVRLGFAIALAFLGTIGIVSYLSVVRLNENSRLVAHSQLVMASIDAIVATTLETESAQRGFLVTGEEP